MSKNGRNRHKGKGTAGKSGAGSPASGSVSLSTFRVGRALDALTPAFVQWFDDGSPGAASIALGCLKRVENVLGRYMDSTAAAEVTEFEQVPLAIAIAEEVAATAGVSVDASADASTIGMADVENTVFVVTAVHAYVGFLSDTGRWSGSAEQLAGVMDFFDDIAEDDDEPGLIDVPYVSEQEALEALSGLPLIRRATALLQWIGDGRPVTATGALRLRDIEAAAACVGVAVRGGPKQTRSTPQGTAGPADDVPTVRSMYEVPLLSQIWNALEAAELIEIKSTKVVPFPDSTGFLTGSDSERLDEFSLFTMCFLEQAVLGFDPEQPWERILAGLQTSILIAAATADPPSLERVLAAAAARASNGKGDDRAPDQHGRGAPGSARGAGAPDYRHAFPGAAGAHSLRGGRFRRRPAAGSTGARGRPRRSGQRSRFCSPRQLRRWQLRRWP